MNGLLTQLLPVVSSILASGGLLALLDRSKRKAEAKKADKEGVKTEVEGQVLISGSSLQWAERADKRAEKAEADAAEARTEAREANKRADQCERDRNDDRERIDDLEKQLTALLARIQGCGAGSSCPVAQSLQS